MEPRSSDAASHELVSQKLGQISRQIDGKGYSFGVGDTGVLHLPLANITGGRRMERSPAVLEFLSSRAPRRSDSAALGIQVESAGEEPTRAESRPQSSAAAALNWPFDYKQQMAQPAFDWRAHRPVTPARSQGGCGCCWAFASVAMMEQAISVEFSRRFDLSEQSLLNCAPGSCGGGFLYNGLEYAREKGVPSEAAVDYQEREMPCLPKAVPCYQVDWHHFVSDDMGIPEVWRTKKAVYLFGAVGTYVIATDLMQSVTSGVYDEFATAGDDHFVTIVGWDDSKPHRRGSGAWLIKNSWGSAWGGENGFGWIPYGANQIGYNAQYVTVDKVGAGCP